MVNICYVNEQEVLRIHFKKQLKEDEREIGP